MGLKDLKKLAREKEFEAYLFSYGITKSDLVYLHEALEIVKNRKEVPENKPVTLTEAERKKISDSYRSKMSPEDLVASFAGESEEFYEDGQKPKKVNN